MLCTETWQQAAWTLSRIQIHVVMASFLSLFTFLQSVFNLKHKPSHLNKITYRSLWAGANAPAHKLSANLYDIVPPLPGYRSATSWVHYTTSCNTQCSAPEEVQNNCPKHVELNGIINKPFLLHLVGCLYYLLWWSFFLIEYLLYDFLLRYGESGYILHTEHIVSASAFQATGRQKIWCIIPHAVKQSYAPEDGQKIARNISSWLEYR